MRLKITFLGIFLVLISCAEKLIKAPENLISEEEMASILYDLAILNNAKANNPNILVKNKIELMPFIFKKYKIDSTQFAQSDLYYASVPLEYQAIYETVEKRLKSEVEAIEKEKKRIKDSTVKASVQRGDTLNLKIKKATKNAPSKK